MSPRTGRPKSNNPKSEEIKIRATKADKEMLKVCCKELNQTQYEVVMNGVRWIYESLNK